MKWKFKSGTARLGCIIIRTQCIICTQCIIHTQCIIRTQYTMHKMHSTAQLHNNTYIHITQCSIHNPKRTAQLDSHIIMPSSVIKHTQYSMYNNVAQLSCIIMHSQQYSVQRSKKFWELDPFTRIPCMAPKGILC